MFLRLDPSSGVPLGVQIVRGVRLALSKGRLAPGEQLPSARELSAQLQVNFHTVRKAYGELQAEGLLDFRRGRGTFVADRRRLPQPDLEQIVRNHVQRLAEDLAGLEVPRDRLRSVVEAELDAALAPSNPSPPPMNE